MERAIFPGTIAEFQYKEVKAFVFQCRFMKRSVD